MNKSIKGQNLRIFVEGMAIASATSCVLHIAAQTEDGTTKDSVGDWSTIEITGRSWDVTTESLVTNEGNDAITTEAILNAACEDSEVTITFDMANGTMNRTMQGSGLKRVGKAYLTDTRITAANRQNATVTATFTGNGPLGEGEVSNTRPTVPGDQEEQEEG